MNREKNRPALWTRPFITITTVNLLLFFGFQLLIPTLPVYVKNMGAGDSVIGWVNGIFTISALIIRPIAGSALDKYGRKGILLSGLLLFIGITAIYPFLPTVGLVLLLRFIHGFGWGAASTASNTVASDVIPKARFGEGIGYFTLAGNLAMALAPAVGLYMIVAYNFSAISLLSVGLVGLSFLLALVFRYKKVDKTESERKERGLFEKSSARPALVMFFITITYGAVNSFIALYAYERGIQNIGGFFTVMAIAMLVSRPGFGWLTDRHGFTVAVIPGLLGVASAMLVLSMAETLPLFLVAALLYGVGFGAMQSSLQAMAVLSAPRHRLGVANSTFYFGFDSGIGFGSVALGMMAAQFGYSRMFLFSTGAVVIAALLYFFTGKTTPETDVA